LLESFGWIIKFFLFIRVLYLMALVAWWHNFLSCLTLLPTPSRVAPWSHHIFWPKISKHELQAGKLKSKFKESSPGEGRNQGKSNSLESLSTGRLLVLPSPSAFKLTIRKYIYLYLTFNGIAKANVTVFAIR
jgi:hypothetical protein